MARDNIFWPPVNEIEEHLYEIRNGSTADYVNAHVEALRELWAAGSPADGAGDHPAHRRRGYLMSNDKSAQPCGCDPGAHYQCERHKAELAETMLKTTKDFTVKDSGERQQFSSGSLRDTTTGKTDYSRALDGPMFKRLAEHLTRAEAKYPDVALGRPNWMLINTEEELIRYRKSALRHFLQWYWGESDEDHAAAVLFNVNGAEYCKERIK